MLQTTGIAFFGLYGSTAALAKSAQRSGQRHRHRIPTRHPHPLAVGLGGGDGKASAWPSSQDHSYDASSPTQATGCPTTSFR